MVCGEWFDCLACFRRRTRTRGRNQASSNGHDMHRADGGER